MVQLNQIREKLSEVIKNSGIKQVDLAAQLGISQQTISHYVKGDILPALDTFANLCVILDLDPAEILCIKA